MLSVRHGRDFHLSDPGGRHDNYAEDVVMVPKVSAVAFDEPHPCQMVLIILGHEASSRPRPDANRICMIARACGMMVDAIPAGGDVTVRRRKLLSKSR